MIVLNGVQAGDGKENVVDVPFASSATSIYLYTDYKKGDEDFVIIKMKTVFKGKEYFICLRNSDDEFQAVLDGDWNAKQRLCIPINCAITDRLLRTLCCLERWLLI